MELGAWGASAFFCWLQGVSFCITELVVGLRRAVAAIRCDGGRRLVEHAPPFCQSALFGAEPTIQDYYDGGGERFARHGKCLLTRSRSGCLNDGIMLACTSIGSLTTPR